MVGNGNGDAMYVCIVQELRGRYGEVLRLPDIYVVSLMDMTVFQSCQMSMVDVVRRRGRSLRVMKWRWDIHSSSLTRRDESGKIVLKGAGKYQASFGGGMKRWLSFVSKVLKP